MKTSRQNEKIDRVEEQPGGSKIKLRNSLKVTMQIDIWHVWNKG